MDIVAVGAAIKSISSSPFSEMVGFGVSSAFFKSAIDNLWTGKYSSAPAGANNAEKLKNRDRLACLFRLSWIQIGIYLFGALGTVYLSFVDKIKVTNCVEEALNTAQAGAYCAIAFSVVAVMALAIWSGAIQRKAIPS